MKARGSTLTKLDPMLAYLRIDSSVEADITVALAAISRDDSTVGWPLRCAGFANDHVARLIMVVGDEDDAWEIELFAEAPDAPPSTGVEGALSDVVDGAAVWLHDIQVSLDWRSVALDRGRRCYVRSERRRYRLEAQAAQWLGEEPPPRALL
jgi:hypothetical protein